MSEPVQLAKQAREQLSRALGALQTNEDVPDDLMAIADPIAEAMSVLHRVERSNGADLAGRDEALKSVRAALDGLQKITTEHPATEIVMEFVALSLSKVHALARYQAPAPQIAQPAPAAAGGPRGTVAIPQEARPVVQPAPEQAMAAPIPQLQPVFAPVSPGLIAQTAAAATVQAAPYVPPQPAPRSAPIQQPAPYVAPAQQPAPYVAPQPAPYAAPPQQPAPYVAPQPAPYVAPAQQPAPQPVQAQRREPAPQQPAQNANPYAPQPAQNANPYAPQPAQNANPYAPQGAAPAPARQEAPPAQPQAAPRIGVSAPVGKVLDVELGTHSSSNFYKGLGGNDVIEHGGIFVATYKIPKIGSTVALRMLLPGDLEFQANAVVQWTREGGVAGESTDPGFGARFTQITAEGRQLVYRYTRNREPIFYDDL